MLRFLRKYSNGSFQKILYGFLALLFVVWGVGAVGGQRVDTVAHVHGRPITRTQLDRARANLERRYEQIFRGAALPREFAAQIPSQALDQLIENALLQEEASRLGIGVADDEVVRYVTGMAEFQEDGRFSHDILKRALDAQRDRGEFEEQVRSAILADRLQNLVTDGVQVSDAELQERYQSEHEQVSLKFVRFTGADLAKDVAFSDDDLQKYLAEHGDRYKVPAKVRARYVAYKASDFADQVRVTDDQISAYYDENKDTAFAIPEQVHVRQILVKTPSDADEKKIEDSRKKATDLLAKIKGGQDFAAVAIASSDDPVTGKSGGDLGLQTRKSMSSELANVAFALDAGTVSDVVQGPDGFYLLKVDDKQPAATKPLDTVRADIVTALKNERGLDLARDQVEADRRSIVRGKSFAEAVGGRTVQETPPFAETDAIPGLGRLPEFAKEAHSLDDGEPSNPIESEGAIYLLTPFERVAAHVAPLADVHERVVADARRDRGQAMAKEKAEALLARAKEVGGLEKAAAETNLKLEDTGAFDRQTGPKNLTNPDLRTDAFALTPEKPLGPKVYPVGGDTVLVTLGARTPADMSGFDAAKDGLRDSILQQKRTTAMTKYIDFLKDRARQEGGLEVASDALGRG